MRAPKVYGMIHFSPLEGDPSFESKECVMDRALCDLEVLVRGGVDGIIFENNFDNPKYESIPKPQAHHFKELVQTLIKDLSLPWGVAPLWNDYRFGFELCKEFGGSLVRVPVFVDSVETTYGSFFANPGDVIRMREEVGASNVLILADVQVKHARMLQPRPLADSVIDAFSCGADGVIITGTWTGDPPTPEAVRIAREASPHGKIYIGSGMTSENIHQFTPSVDGCIVGTAFKETGGTLRQGPNVVPASIRYDVHRVKRFMKAVRL